MFCSSSTTLPHGGAPSDLISSIKARLSRYADDADKLVVFDKYRGISAKDHDRMRRSGEATIDFITSSLPKRDALLKSKTNKQSVLSAFRVQMER